MGRRGHGRRLVGSWKIGRDGGSWEGGRGIEGGLLGGREGLSEGGKETHGREAVGRDAHGVRE